MSTFHWLWALKNNIFGPLQPDSGLLTFLPGAVAGGKAVITGCGIVTTWVCMIACLLLGLHFLSAVLRLFKGTAGLEHVYKRVSKMQKKSLFHGQVFTWYCVSSTGFWFAGGVFLAVQVAQGICLEW